MQYLLTEDEMAEIARQRLNHEKMPTLEVLTTAVQNIACNAVGLAPGTDWHVRRGPSERAHGCIHVGQRGAGRPSYCDFCPVTKICPLPKNWSK